MKGGEIRAGEQVEAGPYRHRCHNSFSAKLCHESAPARTPVPALPPQSTAPTSAVSPTPTPTAASSRKIDSGSSARLGSLVMPLRSRKWQPRMLLWNDPSPTLDRASRPHMERPRSEHRRCDTNDEPTNRWM